MLLPVSRLYMNLSRLTNKLMTRFNLLLLLLILLGLSVRLFRIGTLPSGYYWDEVAMILDVQSVVKTGHDIHGNFFLQPIFPSYGDYKAPVLILFASLISVVLGPTGISLRLVSVFAWIIFIFSGLIFLRFIFSEKEKVSNKVQIFFILIASIIPWSFHFSRVGFEAYLSQSILSLSLVLGYISVRTNKIGIQKVILFISSLLLGSLSSYTYFGSRYVWPLLFIALMMLFGFPLEAWKSKKNLIYRFFTLLLVPSIFFALTMLPLHGSRYYEQSQQYRLSTQSIINFQAQQERVLKSNNWREISGNTLFDRLIFHRQALLLKDFLSNLSRHISINFLFLNGDINLRHGTGKNGLILFSLLPAFIAGFVGIFNKDKKIWIFLVIWSCIAFVPASIPKEIPHALRSLNALFPLIFMVSYGLTIWPKRKWIKILYLGIILVNFVAFMHYYFIEYDKISLQSWQGGYSLLANKVYSHKSTDDRVLVDFPDGKLYLWFLLAGGYSSETIQKFNFENFQLSSFDSIDFMNIDLRDSIPNKTYSLIFVPLDKYRLFKSVYTIEDEMTVDGREYVIGRHALSDLER